MSTDACSEALLRCFKSHSLPVGRVFAPDLLQA